MCWNSAIIPDHTCPTYTPDTLSLCNLQNSLIWKWITIAYKYLLWYPEGTTYTCWLPGVLLTPYRHSIQYIILWSRGMRSMQRVGYHHFHSDLMKCLSLFITTTDINVTVKDWYMHNMHMYVCIIVLPLALCFFSCRRGKIGVGTIMDVLYIIYATTFCLCPR